MPDDPRLPGRTMVRDRLEMHLAQALPRTQFPDVRRHPEAALVECRKLPWTPLVNCPLWLRGGSRAGPNPLLSALGVQRMTLRLSGADALGVFLFFTGYMMPRLATTAGEGTKPRYYLFERLIYD